MLRPTTLALLTFVFCSLGTSCDRGSAPSPVVVRVVRDSSLAADFLRPDAQFVKSEPHVVSGRPVKIEIKEDELYSILVQRTGALSDVLILSSNGVVPKDAATANQLGSPALVCGVHPAFVPVSVRGEGREAAEMYVKFLAAQCPDQRAKVTNAQAPPPEANQPENDPNRPACTTAACLKLKEFLKTHYCGESPFGNGPDDGCDLRGRKNHISTTKSEAEYSCEQSESDGTVHCQQKGEPSPEIREILIEEMRRAGMPVEGETDVHFNVLSSSASGLSLASAGYDHKHGDDIDLCEVIVAIDKAGQRHLIHKLQLQTTDADVPNVTTWVPVDITDINGDGQTELVLQGDAYEDHWLEVVRLQGKSVETIFSGLGYYL